MSSVIVNIIDIFITKFFISFNYVQKQDSKLAIMVASYTMKLVKLASYNYVVIAWS